MVAGQRRNLASARTPSVACRDGRPGPSPCRRRPGTGHVSAHPRAFAARISPWRPSPMERDRSPEAGPMYPDLFQQAVAGSPPGQRGHRELRRRRPPRRPSTWRRRSGAGGDVPRPLRAGRSGPVEVGAFTGATGSQAPARVTDRDLPLTPARPTDATSSPGSPLTAPARPTPVGPPTDVNPPGARTDRHPAQVRSVGVLRVVTPRRAAARRVRHSARRSATCSRRQPECRLGHAVGDRPLHLVVVRRRPEQGLAGLDQIRGCSHEETPQREGERQVVDHGGPAVTCAARRMATAVQPEMASSAVLPRRKHQPVLETTGEFECEPLVGSGRAQEGAGRGRGSPGARTAGTSSRSTGRATGRRDGPGPPRRRGRNWVGSRGAPVVGRRRSGAHRTCQADAAGVQFRRRARWCGRARTPPSPTGPATRRR